MLVSPREFLQDARRGGWAVGGFNVYNLESARAVVQAAEELRAPVMLQTSGGAVAHVGLETMVALATQLTRGVRVPVALHLDHGKDPELARAAIAAGYTSVMIDASLFPMAENVATTGEIIALARPRGVQVEAELGSISGIEDVGDQDVDDDAALDATAGGEDGHAHERAAEDRVGPIVAVPSGRSDGYAFPSLPKRRMRTAVASRMAASTSPMSWYMLKRSGCRVSSSRIRPRAARRRSESVLTFATPSSIALRTKASGMPRAVGSSAP